LRDCGKRMEIGRRRARGDPSASTEMVRQELLLYEKIIFKKRQKSTHGYVCIKEADAAL